MKNRIYLGVASMYPDLKEGQPYTLKHQGHPTGAGRVRIVGEDVYVEVDVQEKISDAPPTEDVRTTDKAIQSDSPIITRK